MCIRDRTHISLDLISLGSAETNVEWGGQPNSHLITSCVRNIPTKNDQNLIIGFKVTVKNVGDVFLRHSVIKHAHPDTCLVPGSVDPATVAERFLQVCSRFAICNYFLHKCARCVGPTVRIAFSHEFLIQKDRKLLSLFWCWCAYGCAYELFALAYIMIIWQTRAPGQPRLQA